MGSKQNRKHSMNIIMNDENVFRDLLERNPKIEPKEYVIYTHEQLGWNNVFIKKHNKILGTLQALMSDRRGESKNNVIILRISSIHDISLGEFLMSINKLDYLPFLILIIDQNQNEKVKDLDKYVAQQLRLNYQQNYISLIKNSKCNTFFLYEKLREICSYYHQLGDQWILPKVSTKHFISNEKIEAYDNKHEEEEEDIDEIQEHKNIRSNTLNFIVIGETGSGKSALINALLGRLACLEQPGKPVTNAIRKYNHDRYPLALYDTIGFDKESEFNDLMKELEKMKKSLNGQNEVIHMIIYTIKGKRTFTSEGIRYMSKIYSWLKQTFPSQNSKNKLPIIFVIANSINEREGRIMQNTVQTNLNEILKDKTSYSIIPIEIYSESSDNSEKPQPFGMNNLCQELYKYFLDFKINETLIDNFWKCDDDDKMKTIEEAIRQNYLIEKLNSLEEINCFCKYKAIEVIGAAAALSVGFGAICITGQSLITDSAVKIGMIIAIKRIFKVKYTKNQASELLMSCIGTNASLAVIQASHVTSSLLNVIPGVNFIDGILCCGTTIGLGMMTIKASMHQTKGEGYKRFMTKVMKGYNSAIDSLEELVKEFDQQYRQISR